MKEKKHWLQTGILLLAAVGIHWFSTDPDRVEQYYSTGIYPVLSTLTRYLTAWLPFSLGDVLYGLVAIWILVQLFKYSRLILKKSLTLVIVKRLAGKGIRLLLLVYILFNIGWGLNYNRDGIAVQMGFTSSRYDTSDLKLMNSLLLQKVNDSKTALLRNNTADHSPRRIFNGASDAYTQLSLSYTFFTYTRPDVKQSLWGWLGNYAGFTGNYNPFTGEGQVNTTVPAFLQYYTTCHEIAHQLGYAKENEANFVGYLAATASKDTAYHYSAYLDLFLYSNRDLWRYDSTSAKKYMNELLPAVKQDIKEWQAFIRRHRNPFEPVIRWMYGQYLKQNRQPQGILSYDEVTGMLIGYYKVYGRI